MTDDIQGKTILVTGGAGFIGSHLVDALAPENEVRVLDNLSTGFLENVSENVEFLEGDVRDVDAVKAVMTDVDIVFHEAAKVSVEQSVHSPSETHAVNMDGVLTVLEAARRESARVVFASSAAIYGYPSQIPIPESESKQPTSPYGIDKLAADLYVRRYAELYDLPTVVLRYFNVYGPRQTAGDYSGVISIFVHQALKDDPITVEGDGHQTRDFVHVSDVVRANLQAAVTGQTGEAFNIGTGDSIRIEELAQTIRETTNSSGEIKHVAPRSSDIPKSEADITKAEDILGYTPDVTVPEGIKDLVQ